MRLSQRLAKLEREIPEPEPREMTDWHRFVTTDPWAVGELTAMYERLKVEYPNGLPRRNGRELFLADNDDYLFTWVRIYERFTGVPLVPQVHPDIFDNRLLVTEEAE